MKIWGKLFNFWATAIFMAAFVGCGGQEERNVPVPSAASGTDYSQQQWREDVDQSCLGLTEEECQQQTQLSDPLATGSSTQGASSPFNDSMIAAFEEMNEQIAALTDMMLDLRNDVDSVQSGTSGGQNSNDADNDAENEETTPQYNAFANSLFAPTSYHADQLAFIQGVLKTDYEIKGNLEGAYEFWEIRDYRIDPSKLELPGVRKKVRDIFRIPMETAFDNVGQTRHHCDAPIVALPFETLASSSMQELGFDESEFVFQGQTGTSVQDQGRTRCDRNQFRTNAYATISLNETGFKNEFLRLDSKVSKKTRVKKYDGDERTRLLEQILEPERAIDRIDQGEVVISEQTGRPIKYFYLRKTGTRKFSVYWLLRTSTTGQDERWQHIKFDLDLNQSVETNPVSFQRLSFRKTRMNGEQFYSLEDAYRVERHHIRTKGLIGGFFSRK